MSSRPSGFTLIELLAVLAVFGLLLAGLTQGVRFGYLAWRTEARIGGADRDLAGVDLALRNLIQAMDPGTDDSREPPLSAEDGAMTIVTALPRGGGSAAVRHVLATLMVDTRQRLLLRWRPFPRAGRSGPAPPLFETELLRGVSRMELTFWRRNAGWVGAWRFNDPPAMIRIRLVFADREARHWPDIVVAPVLGRP
jgi:general secretion pathway protein J